MYYKSKQAMKLVVRNRQRFVYSLRNLTFCRLGMPVSKWRRRFWCSPSKQHVKPVKNDKKTSNIPEQNMGKID